MPPLPRVARHEPALHLAAGRTNRGGRQHALMRAADADQHVDFAFGPGRRDRRGKVAGRDHLDSGAGFAHFVDQLLMARTIENRDPQILDINFFCFGQRLQIVGRRAVEVDHAAPSGPHATLSM